MGFEAELSDEQRARWRALLARHGRPPRGSRKPMVVELATACRWSLATAKARLSELESGAQQGLGAILRNEAARGAVARFLRVTPDDLVAMHEEARTGRADLDRTLLLPGYEDLGPVPVHEAYAPPRVPGWSYSGLGSPVALAPGPPPRLDADLLMAFLGLQSRNGARAVVVEMGEGLGRTATLRYVAATLRGRGVAIGPPGRAQVVVEDDMDRMSLEQRRSILEAIEATEAALVTVCAPDVPTFAVNWRYVYRVRLDVSGREFGTTLLPHLDAVVRARRGTGTPIARVLAWLRDDDLGAAAFASAGMLGLLLRAAEESESARGEARWRLPVRVEDLPETAVTVAVARLRALDRTVAANVLRLVGRDLLARLGPERHDRRRVVAMAADLWAALGKGVRLADLAAFPDALVEGGLVRSLAGGFAVAKAPLGLVARALRDEPGPAVRTSAVALLVRAARDGDATRSLETLLRDPVELHQAARDATAFLGGGVSCADERVFRQAFVALLAWWARRPERETVQGLSPLVLLAQASRGRLGALSDVGPDVVVRPRAPTGWARLLDLVGEPPSIERARLLLALTAPALSRIRDALVVDPPPVDLVPVPGGVLLSTWWERFAAPELAARADAGDRAADDALAGVDGTVPWDWKLGESGLARRVSALERALRRSKPVATTVLARAIAVALSHDAVDLARELLPLTRLVTDRATLAAALVDALPLLRREPEGELRATWIQTVRVCLDEPARARLWTRWLERWPHPVDPDRPTPSPPWSLALDIGVGAALVLDAALGRGEAAHVLFHVEPDLAERLVSDDRRAERLARVFAESLAADGGAGGAWAQLARPEGGWRPVALHLASQLPWGVARRLLTRGPAQLGEGPLWARIARGADSGSDHEQLVEGFRLWREAVRGGADPDEALAFFETVTARRSERVEHALALTPDDLAATLVDAFHQGPPRARARAARLAKRLASPTWRASLCPTEAVVQGLLQILGPRPLEEAVLGGLGTESGGCHAMSQFACAASLTLPEAVSLVARGSARGLPAAGLAAALSEVLARPGPGPHEATRAVLLRLAGARVREGKADPLAVAAAAGWVSLTDGGTPDVRPLARVLARAGEGVRRALVRALGEGTEPILRAWYAHGSRRRLGGAWG